MWSSGGNRDSVWPVANGPWRTPGGVSRGLAGSIASGWGSSPAPGGLARDQVAPGHLRGGLEADQAEDGRRHVGQPAIRESQRSLPRPEDDQRHRVIGVRGVRAIVDLVPHLLGVAVIGGDEEDPSRLLDLSLIHI